MRAEKEFEESILSAVHSYENNKSKKGKHIIIKIVKREKGGWSSLKKQFTDTKKAIRFLQEEDLK